MKGQLTIEYLISFGIFVTLIGYIYLSYTKNIPIFVDEVKKEVTRSEAFQISELLINNPGEPSSWTFATVKRIGLSNNTAGKQNLITMNKINELSNFNCLVPSEYLSLQKKIATNKQVSLFILDINTIDEVRTPLYTCKSPIIQKTAINTTIRRLTAYNDGNLIKTAEIIVQV